MKEFTQGHKHYRLTCKGGIRDVPKSFSSFFSGNNGDWIIESHAYMWQISIQQKVHRKLIAPNTKHIDINLRYLQISGEVFLLFVRTLDSEYSPWECTSLKEQNMKWKKKNQKE